jgi:hypothetical protein
MNTNIKSGDTIIFDTDNWEDLNCRYYVLKAEYNDTSSAIKLLVENYNGSTFVKFQAHHQIIKV